jgi:cytochrome c
MRAAGLIWDSVTLERFLAAPLTMLPGTTMGFAGISDDEERRNLIAFLATLDRSSELCRDVLPAARMNEQ